jgi:uncharacterized protein YecE (DUF72 family)
MIKVGTSGFRRGAARLPALHRGDEPPGGQDTGFFNNCHAGQAALNGRTLMRMLKEEGLMEELTAE